MDTDFRLNKSVNEILIQKVALIHECESLIIEKYANDEMKTPMHMSRGDENCVVGVTEAFLGDSYFFGYYRTHSLYLAATNDPNSFFSEMLGKETGSNNGLSGSMHLSAPEVGLLSTSAIVASTIPLSLGAGLAAKKSKEIDFSVVFFGDGAIEEGVFHETLNMACLFKLPILFVCLDNGLAVDIVAGDRQGFKSIERLVTAYNCEYVFCEQPDVFEAYKLALEAKNTIIKQKKPVFLHMKYYRYLQHIGISSDFDGATSKFEKVGYRSEPEYEKQKEQLPIDQTVNAALKLGHPRDGLQNLRQNAQERALKSYSAALKDPIMNPDNLFHLLSERG